MSYHILEMCSRRTKSLAAMGVPLELSRENIRGDVSGASLEPLEPIFGAVLLNASRHPARGRLCWVPHQNIWYKTL